MVRFAHQNLLKEMERLEKEFNTNMGKTNRCDEKVRPLIKKDVEKLKLLLLKQLNLYQIDFLIL